MALYYGMHAVLLLRQERILFCFLSSKLGLLSSIQRRRIFCRTWSCFFVFITQSFQLLLGKRRIAINNLGPSFCPHSFYFTSLFSCGLLAPSRPSETTATPLLKIAMTARMVLSRTRRLASPTYNLVLRAGSTRSHTDNINAKNVPVISYHDGERSESEIMVHDQPMAPPGIDVQNLAIALKPEVIRQLTPTMMKFTLQGKIAVVTG